MCSKSHSVCSRRWNWGFMIYTGYLTTAERESGEKGKRQKMNIKPVFVLTTDTGLLLTNNQKYFIKSVCFL